MNFYSEFLAQIFEKRIAFFKSANLHKEAELLQARLGSLEKREDKTENAASVAQRIQTENPAVEIVRSNLKERLAAGASQIPELEKQYILESAGKTKTLKELEPLRIAYINRMLKISRANRSKKLEFVFSENSELGAGPYNNEKTFSEALQLIYSQDPLWIEDFKELYFSIMPAILPLLLTTDR